MRPDQLSKNDSEHGHQCAVIAYMTYAANNGWSAAADWSDLFNATRSFELIETNNVLLFEKLNAFGPQLVSKLLWATPNGGKRGDSAFTSKIEGGKLKAEGVKAGVPDLTLAVPIKCSTGGYICPGLYIEMKKPTEYRAGKLNGLSDEQFKYCHLLNAVGYKVEVCYSWRHAIFTIKKYLGNL